MDFFAKHTSETAQIFQFLTIRKKISGEVEIDFGINQILFIFAPQ